MTKTVKWQVSLNLVGCKVKGSFEVEDDATEEEIEEIAREQAFDRIDWNFWVEEPQA